MQRKSIIGFPFFYFLIIMIWNFQDFFFPSLLYNFLLNCDVGPMYCNLNFTCMMHGAMGNLNLTWMLHFRMLQVVWTLLGHCNSKCYGFCCLELTWVTYSIFVLLQHLHLQMLGLDLCFIFIFRVQTFTYSSFCTLKYIGIHVFFSFSWNLLLESIVGIGIQFWNLLLSLNFKFKRFWNFYLKWVKRK
jgi:hypothetical protein